MLDRQALKRALETGGSLDVEALSVSHPSLFSSAELRVAPATLQATAELIAAIESYIQHHNEDPTPFIWTAHVQDILE